MTENKSGKKPAGLVSFHFFVGTLFFKPQKGGQFAEFLDANTTFSDANATIPKVFIFYREKMLDLTGMQSAEQLNSILDVEIEGLDGDEELIAVAYK